VSCEPPSPSLAEPQPSGPGQGWSEDYKLMHIKLSFPPAEL